MRLRFLIFSHIIFVCAAVRCAEPDAPAIGLRPAPLSDVSRLASKLKDPDAVKACAAARELGESRQPVAVVPLLGFYTDGDGERRIAAVKALSALTQWGAAKKTETLLAISLRDAMHTIRRQAAREVALTDGVDSALKRLVGAATDAKAYSAIERNRATHHAAAIAGMKSATFLRETLSSPDIELALAAAEELGEFRDMLGADALIKALGPDRPELQAAAASALERMSGKAYRFDLLKWAEWRMSLRDDFGKESTTAASKESSEYGKPSDYPREQWPADIVIAFDTTASFLHTWPEVNRSLTAVLRELARTEPSLRIGLIRYRALDARVTLKYTLQPTPLTWNAASIEKELSVASFGGGSGALHAALRYAVNGMVWRERSRKSILIIGDDSPVSTSEDPLKAALQWTRDAAFIDGIQINTLYAKTTAGEENRQTYRRLAFSGIGRFYEYNKAERHLVEMSAATVDVKGNELPGDTAKKWFTPREK
ncbi:MAG: HEAT repeat domain-containing protein [Planctomycetota bacterium]